MENKNEVKDLNESEFEEVSGGLDKNTTSVKLSDDEARRRDAWSGPPENNFKCIDCGYRFSSSSMGLLKCSKCGGWCRLRRLDE